MSIVSEIERIKTNIANAYTEIENKGVVTTDAKNSGNLANVISAIQTGGGTGGGEVEKGIKVNGWDSEGYATEIEVVGMQTIPDRYLYMMTYANAWGCRAKVKLSDNSTSLGAYNFYCGAITELDLPDSITYIGNHCLGGSSTSNSPALTNFKLPNALTSVGDNCFQYSRIEKLDFPENIHTFPQRCFYYASTKVIIFRGAIDDIGQEAFMKVSNLQAIIFTKRRSGGGYPRVQDATFNGTIGAIYVPDEDLNAYKTGTNISKMSAKIFPLSEMPEEYRILVYGE